MKTVQERIDQLRREAVNPKKLLKEVIQRALEEPTLLKALSYAAVWDAERMLRQACNNHFETWESVSLFLFECITQEYIERQSNRQFKYDAGDVVMHVKTKTLYRVVETPGVHRLEESGDFAYVYEALDRSVRWVRSASTMEEPGRFVKVGPVVATASVPAE